LKIYKTYFLLEFSKQAQRYRHLKKLVLNKIELLTKDPYRNCKSELLIGELKGLRSARVTKLFRIIFSICEECRTKKFQKFVGCSPSICKNMDSKTIVFLTLGPHERVY
jgi:mRNA-degrading endonuclease YafQ of YafQ-DinJ toxin-antitoxin module